MPRRVLLALLGVAAVVGTIGGWVVVSNGGTAHADVGDPPAEGDVLMCGRSPVVVDSSHPNPHLSYGGVFRGTYFTEWRVMLVHMGRALLDLEGQVTGVLADTRKFLAEEEAGVTGWIPRDPFGTDLVFEEATIASTPIHEYRLVMPTGQRRIVYGVSVAITLDKIGDGKFCERPDTEAPIEGDESAASEAGFEEGYWHAHCGESWRHGDCDASLSPDHFHPDSDPLHAFDEPDEVTR